VVLERYVYDPYGLATVLDADWTADADGQSDAGWQHLHQGGRLDAATGLHHFRHRDYDATLMRWTRQDPAGYVDGMNFHGYLSSSPVVYNDPMGLESVGDQILEYFLIRLVAGGVTLGIATNIATPTKSAYDSEGEMMTQLKGDINNYYASILSKEELDEECWKEVKISGNGASSTASKTFITAGKFLSTGYWLGSSSRVMADGNLWARKTDLGYEIKYVHVRWTWHDNIDANSVAEQIRNGNADFGNVILEGVLVDLVGDKFLNTDFDVEVDFLDRREGTTEIVK
jgi:RHS repeat-associated protein